MWFILTTARRLFLQTHTRLVRQRRRSSDVTESRGRHRISAIKLSRPVQQGSSLTKTADHNQLEMVKISLKPVSAQKPDKENDEEKIAIPQAHVSLHTFVLPCLSSLSSRLLIFRFFLCFFFLCFVFCKVLHCFRLICIHRRLCDQNRDLPFKVY